MNSLNVLDESLDMKIKVLQDIEEYNEHQREAFEQDTPNMEMFDKAIAEKANLIERLEKLDEGFEQLYSRLATELKENRRKYATEIKQIQDKISVITELSVSVQASEARNKKLIEAYFAKERKSVRDGRKGSKAAYDYYKNMSGMALTSPQFMDSKN